MQEHPYVLVTGGAGYIGSHVVLALRQAGWPVVVVDDLSTGKRRLVPDDVRFIEGDIADRALIDAALVRYQPVAVMHFAGSIVVPESVSDPLRYYANNTAASLSLIAACVAAGVDRFIFSSTAAVYGEPARSPVSETDPTVPINPYGSSKLCTEWVLRDTAAATPLEYVALRYFNVAGADPEGRSGQSMEKATHLIKVACQAALGLRKGMEVFGDDYPTADGTCVRDYIHVSDLAEAHVRALDYLVAGGKSIVLNCGYGHGFSVREVLETVRAVAEGRLEWRIGPRRAGDPPALVSANTRIRETLGWQPRFDDLRFIVETAMDWEQRLIEKAL
ncbi:MAG: UDP-glucose 4-epimerase GalE [Rhodospirillales bacterium]|nr:UDP-glucose 4-epimerase GalE [Rhodospirillales bacterium]